MGRQAWMDKYVDEGKQLRFWLQIQGDRKGKQLRFWYLNQGDRITVKVDEGRQLRKRFMFVRFWLSKMCCSAFFSPQRLTKHRIAEWLALSTSDDGVPGSNPGAGEMQLMTVRCFNEPFIIIVPSCRCWKGRKTPKSSSSFRSLDRQYFVIVSLAMYYEVFCKWIASGEKVPSNMCQLRRFRSSCATAKYHLGICSRFIHHHENMPIQFWAP